MRSPQDRGADSGERLEGAATSLRYAPVEPVSKKIPKEDRSPAARRWFAITEAELDAIGVEPESAKLKTKGAKKAKTATTMAL